MKPAEVAPTDGIAAEAAPESEPSQLDLATEAALSLPDNGPLSDAAEPTPEDALPSIAADIAETVPAEAGASGVEHETTPDALPEAVVDVAERVADEEPATAEAPVVPEPVAPAAPFWRAEETVAPARPAIDPALLARIEKLESSAARPVAAPPAQKRRGGFVPLLLGGVIAGGIGYGAGKYLHLSDGPDPVALISELDGKIANLSSQTAELPGRIESVEGQVQTLSVLPEQVTAAVTAAQAAASAESLTVLEERLAAVEQRPIPDGQGGTVTVAGPDPAQAAELAALRKLVDEQVARTEALAAEATEAQSRGAAVSQEVTVQAASLRLKAAVESGGPFGAALDELEAAGVTIPEALRAEAEGLPSLIDLERDFLPAAREALYVSVKATVKEGALDRTLAFLQTQLGARSLNPREGDDPDAVLSRAEAAVKDGALDLALTEIAKLPAEGQTAMEPWTAQVNRRLAAEAAVSELSASLNTN